MVKIQRYEPGREEGCPLLVSLLVNTDASMHKQHFTAVAGRGKVNSNCFIYKRHKFALILMYS